MNDAVLPGQRLKNERESQGLSVEDVSARLRLSRSYLAALEADDYERLPEDAFIKGYMRNYAKLLGLPQDELAGAFERLREDRQPEPKIAAEPRPGSSQALPVWLLPAAAAVLLIVLLIWWSVGGEPDMVAENTDAAAVTDTLVLPEDELDAQAPPLVEGEPRTEGSVDEMVSPQAVEDAAPVADTLSMQFSDECWLEVHEVGSGEQLYQGQQSAGSRLQLQGEGPFRLTLGNASALSSLRFNDQDLTPPSGPSGRVVRVNVP